MSITYIFNTLRKSTYLQWAAAVGFIYALFMSIAPIINYLQGDITLGDVITTVYSIGYGYSLIFLYVMIALFVGYHTKIYLSMGMKIKNVIRHYHVFTFMTMGYTIIGGLIMGILGLWVVSRPFSGFYLGIAPANEPLKALIIYLLFYTLVAYMLTNIIALIINMANRFGATIGISTAFFSLAVIIFSVPFMANMVIWMDYWLLITLVIALVTGLLLMLNHKLLALTEVNK